MKYFLLDYKGNLKQITLQRYLKAMYETQEGIRENIVAFESPTHTLITDSAVGTKAIEKAILKMLQEYITFDID